MAAPSTTGRKEAIARAPAGALVSRTFSSGATVVPSADHKSASASVRPLLCLRPSPAGAGSPSVMIRWSPPAGGRSLPPIGGAAKANRIGGSFRIRNARGTSAVEGGCPAAHRRPGPALQRSGKAPWPPTTDAVGTPRCLPAAGFHSRGNAASRPRLNPPGPDPGFDSTSTSTAQLECRQPSPSSKLPASRSGLRGSNIGRMVFLRSPDGKADSEGCKMEW